MMETYGLHIVIVAGGLGSRLAPCTNHIPKFLVNIGKQTGYVEMIRYWKQYTSFERPEFIERSEGDGLDDYDFGSITVIVHSSYAPLVQAYHDLYFPTMPLTIKCVDVANGSAHAILSSCDHLVGKSVFFQWCDVYPVDQLPVGEMIETFTGSNVVFTNYNNSNRYGLERVGEGWYPKKVVLKPDQDGGIFGLYYISHFKTDVKFEDGQDFVEVLDQFGKLAEHKIEHIIDFGDMPKLIRTRALQDEAREFNTIEFVGDHVFKAATNNQGQDIIAKEIAWYEKLGELNVHNFVELPVPKVWVSPNRDSFFMTKAKGVPIWKAWSDLSPVDRKFVMEQVIDGQQKLFDLGRSYVAIENVINDVRIESGTKLFKRYAEIENVIKAFGDMRVVNGHELQELDPRVTIHRLCTALEDHYLSLDPQSLEYGFIHGDLQFSNAMVDIETRRVTIIDPRGYFGKTTGYGLADYDLGKMLYALHGYDQFNYNKTFGIQLDGRGRLDFVVDHPSHEGIEGVLETHFKREHYLWLAVCWIGLAQYVKNDPVKSVAAHYHGLAMAEQILARV